MFLLPSQRQWICGISTNLGGWIGGRPSQSMGLSKPINLNNDIISVFLYRIELFKFVVRRNLIFVQSKCVVWTRADSLWNDTLHSLIHFRRLYLLSLMCFSACLSWLFIYFSVENWFLQNWGCIWKGFYKRLLKWMNFLYLIKVALDLQNIYVMFQLFLNFFFIHMLALRFSIMKSCYKILIKNCRKWYLNHMFVNWNNCLGQCSSRRKVHKGSASNVIDF